MKRILSIAFLALFASLSLAQIVPVTNDDCSTPISILDGINPSNPTGLSGNVYTNVGATATAGAPTCISATYLDVWFSYTATATGTVSVATCTPAGFTAGTLNDTVVSILDSSACPPTIQLACNDDFCGLLSTATASVVAGTTYYVRVSGYGGSSGTFYLTISPPQPPPVNDGCAGAIGLSLGANGPYTNVSATDSGTTASCGFAASPGYKDLWFQYTAVCNQSLTIDTGCNAFDTILTVYGSCGGAEIACNDDATNCGLSSNVTFPATAGVTYLIRAASWSTTAAGSFTINVNPSNGMSLGYSSPFGPGSLQIAITNGPPAGGYAFIVTFYAGAYPNGWLFGVDIPLTELNTLIATGFPFLGGLDGCGAFTLGPIGGLGFLSGISFYAVALGLPAGSATPTIHSAATTYTIP